MKFMRNGMNKTKQTKSDRCVWCNHPFSDKNVFSDLGWREVEISQMCEKCFDSIEELQDDLDDSLDEEDHWEPF